MTDAAINPTKIPGDNDRATFSPGDQQLPVSCFFIAKGFSRIFWGLLLAMVLFFGNAAVELFHCVKLPAYVAGSALAVRGLWMLSDAGPVSLRWRRRVRAALALLLLQIYFAPFLEWWKAAPGIDFYFINVLGLILISMLAFFFVNLLAADTFWRMQGGRGAQIEALVFALGVVLLMIVPLIVTIGFSFMAAWRYNTNFALEMWQSVMHLPTWAYMILTLPCSLTLITAWKAKVLCYSRVVEESGGGVCGGRW